ncbi:MAG: hypothetical protein FWE53_02000 [Firmicutes bacterium]|nr:hypothetical protein [Bacillota bacterium]
MFSSLILAVDILAYLGRTHVILAMVFAALGIIVATLATRFVTAANKGEKPAAGDTRVIVLKSVGFVLIVIGLILACIPFGT